MSDHSPDCDSLDANPEGIRKPCNCRQQVRDLISDLRGGIPGVCDFCGAPTPEDELHPEEAGEWICNKCIARIGYGPDPKPDEKEQSE